MKKKTVGMRIQAYSAVLALSAALLAGCGSKAETAAETTATVETTEAESEAAEKTEAAASKETAESKGNEASGTDTETTESSEETTDAAESKAEDTEGIENAGTDAETHDAEDPEDSTGAGDESADGNAESQLASSEAGQDADNAKTDAGNADNTDPANAPETQAEEQAENVEVTLEATGTEDTDGTSPAAIFSALSQSLTLPELFPMGENYVSNYLGIDVGLLEGFVFEISDSPIAADSVIIMQAKDESGVETLQNALTMYQDSKKAELENYAPEGYQVAAAGSVKTKGNYVYLVMLENAREAEAVIEKSIA